MRNPRAAIFYVPLLMILVFGRQLYLEKTTNLDPWLGGGMRMYATIDGFHNRVVGLQTTINDESHFINLNSYQWFSGKLDYVRILPSNERLQSLASHLETLTLCFESEEPRFIPADKFCPQTIPLTEYDLTVYRLAVVDRREPALKLQEISRLSING